ncbi:hypothetical protein [Amycolatopsis saalfeldensis]|uniref:Uncharacterized protein n=1 Tax=Amycolatopsis saalfeldensis TaxID=394193 RepID=A0A1H8YJL0_9PSEU|nr:hypothetical protein [Amycolatopsis saalfeldensis]SEP52345.1 hypothetical protein SAMN04489732_1208 [Amycolatopsis saalfeldensis]
MSIDATARTAPRYGHAVGCRTVAELEARLSCPVVHVDPGTGMSHALDEHLAAGFDIESASDGWVVLRRASVRFVLAVTARGAVR